jgi:ribose transport system substrate-binding protein
MEETGTAERRDHHAVQSRRCDANPKGVDAILVCCSNPTALNQSVKYAYDHCVPTFSLTGYLTSPYSVNASVNYQLAGYQLGKWLTDQLGGNGNVMVDEGIPGTSGSPLKIAA